MTRLVIAPVFTLLVAMQSVRSAEPDTNPFDGKSLSGWTTADGKPVTKGWEIVDGEIHLKKGKDKGGNIVTAREFGEFTLSFEWKIAPKGNSGIKYWVGTYDKKVLGLEYQVYDDAAVKGKLKPKGSSGALYDLYEPNTKKKLKPAGEYNTAKIVVAGGRIEHWLNGEKIVSAVVGSPEWDKRLAESKFSDVEGFVAGRRGKFMLTDHGSEAWYRNFQFEAKPMPAAPPKPDFVKETFVYKQVGDLKIKADVFVREGSKAPRPVVVWIHGGGLINGHRESVPSWLHAEFLPRGYAIVSIDYRLAPESKLPDIAEDVADAIDWVRAIGPQAFGADPKRVAVAGGSAGGFLTLLSGFRVEPPPTALVSLWGYGDMGADWTFEASSAPRHNGELKTTPAEAAKVAALPPVSDSRERQGDGAAVYQLARRNGTWAETVSGWNPQKRPVKFIPFMPERNVSPDYPPTLFIHGDADTDVPFESTERMAAELKKHGVEHKLIRFQGAEHGLPNADEAEVAAAYHEAAEFIVRQFAKR